MTRPWRELAAAAALAVGCGSPDDPGDAGPSRVLPRPPNPACLAPGRPGGSGVALRPAFPALPAMSAPTALAQPPDDPSRWYATEKGGRVHVFTSSPDVTELSTALDLSDVTFEDGDVGLLAIAFPPDFADSGAVYLAYSRDGGPTGHRSRLSRFTSGDGGDTFDPDSEQILLEIDQDDIIHQHADVQFGPDGYLYVGWGDGGPQLDPQDRGQDPFELRGKILRLDVSGLGDDYAIPADNPFADGVEAAPEVWASGFRNPWRMGFDRDTGDLWLGDVGNDRFEEIDVVVRGGNYGWAVREGFECLFDPPCDLPGIIDPVHAYSHQVGSSVAGGRVYRGSAVPALAGRYVFADFITGELFALPPGTAGGDAESLGVSGMNLVAFAEDEDGELYAVDHAGGRIHRFVPETTSPGELPATLADTGCFDPADPGRALDGAIAYDIQSPLWSDGADKRRWLAIPDGETIDIADDGDLVFPVGSVLIKEFAIEGRKIETRLLVRHDDGDWAGYAYAWDDTGTIAVLLEDGRDIDLPGSAQTWRIPSRADCMRCHTSAAGRTLGLDLAQLDRDAPAPDGVFNQLDTLAAMGMLARPVPAERPALVSPDDEAASLDDRARSYLHANCSHCHRPGGPGRGGLDLRATAAIEDVGACDAAPRLDDLGITDARVIAPGDPDRSVLLRRMLGTGTERMPPVGTLVVDPDGTELVRAWIAASACR